MPFEAGFSTLGSKMASKFDTFSFSPLRVTYREQQGQETKDSGPVKVGAKTKIQLLV